jgi:hypothetical protein
VDPKLSMNPHGVLNPSRVGGECGWVDGWGSSAGAPLVRTGLGRGEIGSVGYWGTKEVGETTVVAVRNVVEGVAGDWVGEFSMSH